MPRGALKALRGPYHRKLTMAQLATLYRLKQVDQAYQRVQAERNRLMVELVRSGVSCEEIARRIDISPSTVSRRVALYFNRNGDWTDRRRKRGRVI